MALELQSACYRILRERAIQVLRTHRTHTDLIHHVTRAVYLDAEYIQKPVL